MTSAIAIVKQIPLFQLECFVIFFSLQQRNMSIANIIIKDFMHTIILPIAFPCTTLWRCGSQASALVMVILLLILWKSKQGKTRDAYVGLLKAHPGCCTHFWGIVIKRFYSSFVAQLFRNIKLNHGEILSHV